MSFLRRDYVADDSTESGQSITEQSMSILLLPASTTDRLVAQLAGWHLLDRAGDGRLRRHNFMDRLCRVFWPSVDVPTGRPARFARRRQFAADFLAAAQSQHQRSLQRLIANAAGIRPEQVTIDELDPDVLVKFTVVMATPSRPPPRRSGPAQTAVRGFVGEGRGHLVVARCLRVGQRLSATRPGTADARR